MVHEKRKQIKANKITGGGELRGIAGLCTIIFSNYSLLSNEVLSDNQPCENGVTASASIIKVDVMSDPTAHCIYTQLALRAQCPCLRAHPRGTVGGQSPYGPCNSTC
jgi:hypothetical protein